MSKLHIDDIQISYAGEDLSQFGLFPLVAWYFLDVFSLRELFEQTVTVNKKRNHNRQRKPKQREFSDADMCLGLMILPILGIERIAQITERMSTETELAKLLGLSRFFDPSTGHEYLNQFGKWHVRQLDSINHQLLLRHGACSTQPIIVVDIDAQTHTLESRQREGAVVGYNRKKRGQPCYQWNVAFVCNEAVAQRLMAGNTHCQRVVIELLEEVTQQLDAQLIIIRLDGGYLSGELLNTLIEKGLQLCISCRYDWVLSQGVCLDETKWQPIDENTRIYDVGQTPVVSTCCHPLRVVLVEKKQNPFPGSKSQRELFRYGICERLAFHLSAKGVYDFYHSRQTIEQFFKESTGPFSAGKMPSQKLRANEAYLQLVTIAENCMLWFKKNFSLPNGCMTRCKRYEVSSFIMGPV